MNTGQPSALSSAIRHVCRSLCRLLAAVALFGTIATSIAEPLEAPSKGQTVYLPIYSEIWHGNLSASGKADTALLSILVSIRNTDPKTPIRVNAASYYNTVGRLLRETVPMPRVIAPFGTLELFVELKEDAGGSGANYAIRWDAGTAVSPPIIEALHTRFQAGYSVAFISRGKAISAP